MRAIMECDCGFVGEDAETFDRHMSECKSGEGSLDWWRGPGWAKRGPFDGILRLLQQDEITRGKALELIRQRITGDLWDAVTPAPWDKLNWAD